MFYLPCYLRSSFRQLSIKALTVQTKRTKVLEREFCLLSDPQGHRDSDHSPKWKTKHKSRFPEMGTMPRLVRCRGTLSVNSDPSGWFESGKFGMACLEVWWMQSDHDMICGDGVCGLGGAGFLLHIFREILPFLCPWEFHLFKWWSFSWCQDTVFVLVLLSEIVT